MDATVTSNSTIELLNEDNNYFVESGSYFIIDKRTRKITAPKGFVTLGVESDADSERIWFECPRYVGDNVDLTTRNIYINYENANGEKDAYYSDDVVVDGDNVHFSWKIQSKVVRYKGDVKFIVCAMSTDEEGMVIADWNTTLCTAPVLEGLEVKYPQPYEEEYNIINQLIDVTKNAISQMEENRLAFEKEIIVDVALNVDEAEGESWGNPSLEEFTLIFGSGDNLTPNVKYTLIGADGTAKYLGYFTDKTGTVTGIDDDGIWKQAQAWDDFAQIAFHGPDLAVGDILRLSRTEVKKIDDKFIPDTVARAYEEWEDVIDLPVWVYLEETEGGASLENIPASQMEKLISHQDADNQYWLKPNVKYTILSAEGTFKCSGYITDSRGESIVNDENFSYLLYNIFHNDNNWSLSILSHSNPDLAEGDIMRLSIGYVKQIDEKFIPDTIARTIMTSPSGKKFKLTVGDDGALTTTAVE